MLALKTFQSGSGCKFKIEVCLKYSNRDPVEPANCASPALLPLFTTSRTLPVVHIDRSPASRTGPAFPLGFDKLSDAVFTDSLKVLDHAHAVLFPVPLVQLPQSLAGEFSTSMMVPAPYFVAGRNGAALVAPPVGCVTSVAMVFLPEICHADGAVHAAGCNEGGSEGIVHRHKCG